MQTKSPRLLQVDLVFVIIGIDELVDGQKTVIVVLHSPQLILHFPLMLMMMHECTLRRQALMERLHQICSLQLQWKLPLGCALSDAELFRKLWQVGLVDERNQQILKSFFPLPSIILHLLDEVMILLHEFLILNEKMSTRLF